MHFTFDNVLAFSASGLALALFMAYLHAISAQLGAGLGRGVFERATIPVPIRDQHRRR